MTVTENLHSQSTLGRMLSLFNNRRISTKISIGFACVLVVMAIISGKAYVDFGTVGKGFAAFQQRVSVVSIARDADRGFLAFRRFVREYAVTGEEKDVKDAMDRRKVLNSTIEQGLKTIKNPERLAKMQQIRDEVATYAKDFDKLIFLRREQDKLTREVLDPSGIKMRTDIEQLQALTVAKAGNSNVSTLAGEAMKQLMLARLSVNKLLGRHEQAAADAAEKAFKDMMKVVAAIEPLIVNDEVRKLHGEIKTLADKYHAGYVRASALSHEIETLMNGEMAKAANDIAANADRIKQDGIADEQAIELETEHLIASTEGLLLIFAAVGFALALLLAWMVGRAISKPVAGLVAAMRKLGDGDFSVVLPGLGRKDEVGEMAQAVEAFKIKAADKARLEAEERMAEEVRAADAKRAADEREAAQQRAAEEKAAADRKAAMHRLADDFEKAVGGIIGAVSSASTELEAAANTLTKTAETTQELSTVVASASEEASSNVQSVASATEEMTGSVGEISRQVQESSSIANEAVVQAQKTDARITELSHAASRIGDVVKLITAVAEQTNLLALNATIEAARAGEAGRGFAVVASEVKALAAQTAKATSEISTQIAGMQTATQDSVTSIKEIGGTIRRISEIAATIAAAVEEQGAATQEISRNVQEAAKGTAQVATNITAVNRGASETGSASSQVLSSAQSLASESNHLKVEVAKFLDTVRAA
jgi:methyl-accepting chemotaxis protein